MSIAYNRTSFVPNESRAFPITNDTRFVLKFSPWREDRPKRNLPFKLSIDGASVAGKPVALAPVPFKPKT